MKKEKRERKSLTGSFPAKVAAFFLLVISSFVTAVSVFGCAFDLTEDLYREDTVDEAFLSVSHSQFLDAAYALRDMLLNGEEQWRIEQYFEEGNLDVDLFYGNTLSVGKENNALIWGTFDNSYVTTLTMDFYLKFSQYQWNIKVAENYIPSNDTYIFRVYANPIFPHNDNLRMIYEAVRFLFEMRYVFIWSALAGGFVLILCFVFLMCSAGHSNKREDSRKEDFSGIWLDVLAAVFFLATMMVWLPVYDLMSRLGRGELLFGMLLVGALAAVLVSWLTLFLYEVARQMKQGKWWRHTLIYIVLKCCYKALRFLGRCFFRVLQGLPTVFTTLIAYCGICILELLGIMGYMRPRSSGMTLWMLEKVLLLPLILYVAISCKRLLKASDALVEGQQDHVVDTSLLFGDFKTHGENLNSIGEGISRAVEARIKSERLKTELITNVSHDLKTPLTSIINYSDLICEEETENEKIKEYSQVLKRQSGRLKKLLEDLVEASKATTGNLEVNLVPCEVGVILSQAVGEYQTKLEEKDLELRITQPEEPVRITADGRHLWRVFDNLLNNICKYAQEGSRVYLNVELMESRVQIIFRNMSKYPLNMSAEELEERFVRGDKSRHMEGNGLGLSIAKSLMELQGGELEILTDGDLFKVTLTFTGQKE